MKKDVMLDFEDVSNGAHFILGDGLWEIEELKGIFAPSFTVNTQTNAQGIGLRTSGKQLKGRDISFTASVNNTDYNDTERLRANKFFNPLHSFKVYITYYGTTRWAECELTGIDCPQALLDEPTKLTGMVLCMSPYLKSMDDFGKDISLIVPAFTFPYVSPMNDGFIFGYYNFGNEVTLVNDGDSMTQCKLVFTARGVLKNPKIVKNGKEYVKVIADMVTGDEVAIDFYTGRILYNGQRYTKIDRKSTFFYLDVGINKLKAEADENTANLSTVIYYNSEYLGV